jgi:hypothetical protein
MSLILSKVIQFHIFISNFICILNLTNKYTDAYRDMNLTDPLALQQYCDIESLGIVLVTDVRGYVSLVG